MGYLNRSFVLGMLLAGISLPQLAGAFGTVWPVVVAGDAAEGYPDGVTHTSFKPYHFDDNAQVFFFSTVAGSPDGERDNEALYANTELQVKKGNTLGGRPIAWFDTGRDTLPRLAGNAAGDVTFFAGLQVDAGPPKRTLARLDRRGNAWPVYKQGDEVPAPLISSEGFRVDNTAMGPSGDPVFAVSLPSDKAVLRGRAAPYALIAQSINRVSPHACSVSILPRVYGVYSESIPYGAEPGTCTDFIPPGPEQERLLFSFSGVLLSERGLRSIEWHGKSQRGPLYYLGVRNFDAERRPLDWTLYRKVSDGSSVVTSSGIPLFGGKVFTARLGPASFVVGADRGVALCAEELDGDTGERYETIYYQSDEGAELQRVAALGDPVAAGDSPRSYSRLCLVGLSSVLFNTNLALGSAGKIFYTAATRLGSEVTAALWYRDLQDADMRYPARLMQVGDTPADPDDLTGAATLGTVSALRLIGANYAGQAAWHADFSEGGSAIFIFTPDSPSGGGSTPSIDGPERVPPLASCFCPAPGTCLCDPRVGCRTCETPGIDFASLRRGPIRFNRNLCESVGTPFCREDLPVRLSSAAANSVLRIEAQPELWVGVLNAQGEMVAQSHPRQIISSRKKAPAVQREVPLGGLPAGDYTLAFSGPAGAYALVFGDAVATSDGARPWLTWLFGLIAVIAVSLLVIMRRKD